MVAVIVLSMMLAAREAPMAALSEPTATAPATATMIPPSLASTRTDVPASTSASSVMWASIVLATWLSAQDPPSTSHWSACTTPTPMATTIGEESAWTRTVTPASTIEPSIPARMVFVTTFVGIAMPTAGTMPLIGPFSPIVIELTTERAVVSSSARTLTEPSASTVASSRIRASTVLFTLFVPDLICSPSKRGRIAHVVENESS